MGPYVGWLLGVVDGVAVGTADGWFECMHGQWTALGTDCDGAEGEDGVAVGVAEGW